MSKNMVGKMMLPALMLSSAPLALAPSLAHAQDAAADAAASDNNGVIVVTARRREETLIDVPIAVSAFSGEKLAEQVVCLEKIGPILKRAFRGTGIGGRYGTSTFYA